MYKDKNGMKIMENTDKQILYWAHMLDESYLKEDTEAPLTVSNFLKMLADDDLVKNRYMNSKLHVGTYGSHIGDVLEIKKENGSINLIVKRAKVTGRRGPVEGCMSLEEIIEQLEDFVSEDESVSFYLFICTIPVTDELSIKMGKKPETFKIETCDIARVDGVWLRPEDK